MSRASKEYGMVFPGVHERERLLCRRSILSATGFFYIAHDMSCYSGVTISRILRGAKKRVAA
jgi:hypothetical protein